MGCCAQQQPYNTPHLERCAFTLSLGMPPCTYDLPTSRTYRCVRCAMVLGLSVHETRGFPSLVWVSKKFYHPLCHCLIRYFDRRWLIRLFDASKGKPCAERSPKRIKLVSFISKSGLKMGSDTLRLPVKLPKAGIIIRF